MTPGHDELILRPSRQHQGKSLLIWAVFATVITVPVAFAAGLAGGLIAGGIVAVLFGLAWGSWRASRIMVTRHELIVRGLFTRRRRPRAQAAGVIRAHFMAVNGRVFPTVFVVDRVGKLVIRINVREYDHSGIDHLVSFLGLPHRDAGLVTGPQLATIYPGLITSMEANPIRFALRFAAAGILCVLVIAIVVTAVIS
jgi:hypothetical protein